MHKQGMDREKRCAVNPQDVLSHFVVSRRLFDDDRHNGTPGYLRASEFGPCLREQHFKRLGIERTNVFDDKTLLTFEWGNLLEAVVEVAYTAVGLMRASQVKVRDDELRTTCTFDFLVGGEISVVMTDEVSRVRTLFTLLGMNASRSQVADWMAEMRTNYISKWGVVHPVSALECKSQKDSAMVWAYKQGPSDGYKLQVGVQQLLAERNPDQMPIMPESYGIVYVGKGNWGVLHWDAEPEWKWTALERINMLARYQDTDIIPSCFCGTAWNGKYRWNPNMKRGYCSYADPEKPGLCCDASLIEKVEVSA
jgi:hypothetical protein